MNRIIEELAVSMPKVKFLRMNVSNKRSISRRSDRSLFSQASSNGIEVDRVTLPILTLYK